VLACDGGYAMPLATAIRSIVEANRPSWPLEIHILSNGFSQSAKGRVVDSQPAGSCSINWAHVDLAAFAGFSTLPHISTMAYARLLIPSILPDGILRALYLDADILVLDDLAPLCELDLNGAVVGAVLDKRLDTQIKLGNTCIGGLPLPRVRDYFNDGVLLIDVEEWRSKQIPEKAMEYLRRCPNTVYGDQDALNFACDGAWRRLDLRWNHYQIDLEKPLSKIAAPQRPGIVHFHGWSKPWDPGALNLNAGFYDSFRTRTLFARTLSEKFGSVPTVVWSQVKKGLRQSATVRRVWKRLQPLRPV
jgi:lipopolysaccharide biosynthesis glycosyltransferase